MGLSIPGSVLILIGFRFMFQNFIPHKNKEIKRMLSNKMTVSLMSLITIIALAFVTPSAMADDFDVKIMGPTNVAYMLADPTGY